MKIVSILTINCMVLLVLLCMVEVGLRIVHIPYHPEWEPSENAIARFDKELGWSYLPNLNRPVLFENSERMVYTDSNGIRVPSPGYNLSADKPSVLFVGCSYTMGHGLSYQESFVGQLDAYVGNPYQLVNLGVQAYGTDQAYLAMKRFAPRFNTKVVVYTFMEEHIGRNGVNDRGLLMPTAHLLGTKPMFALSGNDGIRLAKPAVRYMDYRRSYLLDALTITVGARLGLFPPYPEDLTIRLIQQMDRYCKERGIRFVLLNWRWNTNSYNKFSMLDVDAIDTLEHAPPGWESMRIPGDNHPNAEAGRHVARLLRDYLKSGH